MWKKSAAIGVVFALAGLAGAQAQIFDDRANETVRQRQRPEYDPRGVLLGRFIGRPDFRVGLRYEDNIFARDQRTSEDLIVNILAAGELRSDWRRHEVAAFYSMDYDYYTDFTDESNVDLTIGLRGRLDVGRSTEVEGRVSFTDGNERRVAADAVIGVGDLRTIVLQLDPSRLEEFDEINSDGVFADRPINFNVWRAGATVRHTFDQLRLIGDFEAAMLLYFNEFSQQLFDQQELTDEVLRDNGSGLGPFQVAPGIIDQSFRDRAEYRVSGRAEYQFTPSTFALGSVTYKDNDYRTDIDFLDRSSTGFEILTGFGFDLTRVLRGEAALKYFTEEFEQGFGEIAEDDEDDPFSDGVIGDGQGPLLDDDVSSGFGAAIDLTWLVTTLTNVSLVADREVTATSLVDASRIVATRSTLTVDHELDRNILLYGELSYFLEEFEGIDREDERFEYGLGLLYLLNNRYSLEMNLARTQQESVGSAGRDFDINRVFAGLQVRF